LKASHFAYERVGIVHTRTLCWGAGSELIIEDELTGRDEHSVEANFVLGTAWKADSIDQGNGETVCRLAGPHRAEISFSAQVPLEVNREVGQISRLFGCYREADKLSVRLVCTLPVIIRTILRWED
jgi:hypothetical protein